MFIILPVTGRTWPVSSSITSKQLVCQHFTAVRIYVYLFIAGVVMTTTFLRLINVFFETYIL